MLRVIFDLGFYHRAGAEDGKTGMSHCFNGVCFYCGICGRLVSDIG